MSMVSPIRFRNVINNDDRDYIFALWLMKHEAGVPSVCKTFWYKKTPMWTQYVMKKTGISYGAAVKRLTTWVRNGDMKLLLKPKSVRKPVVKPKSEPVDSTTSDLTHLKKSKTKRSGKPMYRRRLTCSTECWKANRKVI